MSQTVVLYGNVEPKCADSTCRWKPGEVTPRRVELVVSTHVENTGHTVMVGPVAGVRYAPQEA